MDIGLFRTPTAVRKWLTAEYRRSGQKDEAESASQAGRPNDIKTPATIAIMMGMGRSAIIFFTAPLIPKTKSKMPVPMNAPMTSGNVELTSAGPTKTEPDIVQKNANG